MAKLLALSVNFKLLYLKTILIILTQSKIGKNDVNSLSFKSQRTRS